MAPRGEKRANARDTAPHTLAELQKRVEHVIPAAFDQAQSSAATHQKNWVALHKLHAQASEVDYGLPEFEQGFIACAQKVLSIKKGAGGGVGERLVKFISGYVKHINEKVGEEAPEEEEETYASKFVDCLVNHVLKGFVAKDKIVRYRCVQIISESVAFLGAIDEDLYRTLRASFLARTEDKEPPIRVQAVLALGKLLPSDDPQEKGERIIDVVQDVLQFDPSGDVRRTALISLPLSRNTLPTLLTRIRDTDATVRRTLYSAVITRLKPQHLSPEQLARVVNCGLRDREESVKTAAKNLVAGWAGKLAAAEGGELQQNDGNGKEEAVDLLVNFVALFDLASSLEPVERALECVFEMRRDLLDKVEFAEDYWLALTPERALLARCFVDYCVKHKDEAHMERALPVVTALAFRVQDEVHKLDTAQTEVEDDEEKPEDVDAEQVFIVGEMLRMAAELDYSDEIGRRKMFALVRDMLSQPSLPDPLLAPCLDVLRVLSASERDLIRVVVEIVHELRDPEDEADAEDVEAELFADEDDDASQASISKPVARPPKEKKKFEDMMPEEQERATAMDLRCLGLCIGMLERVNGSFEENSTLEGILADLIIPAVKRKETLLRERGLIGLGLCCLIAKRMALNSFQLFLGQITSAPEPLKVRVLQIAFDIMMVHEAEFLGERAVVGEGKMVDFLLHTLENTESDEVQNVLCVGLSKLMLSGMISDERVLKALVLAYLSPQTADNQALRQCLAYFLPVYCFSSSGNQRRMQRIAIPMFSVMNQVREDYGDEPGMISQAQVGEILLGWTNPEHLIDVPGMKQDETVHMDLAIDIVQTLFEDDIEVGNKKILCQMLSKVFVPNELDDDKLRKLVVLLSNVKRRRPLGDSTASSHLEKFEKSIHKKFADKLEGVSEEDYRKLEHLNDIFAFLDAIPEAEEEEEEPAPKKRATRAKSTTASKTPARSRKKKQSDSDDDSDGGGSRATGSRAASPTPTPARVKLARSAAPKKSLAVDVLDDEDEEEDEDEDEDEEDNDEDDEEEEASPKSTDKGKQRSPASASEEAADDDDALSSLSEPDDDDAEDNDATPVAASKQHGTSAEKRGAQAAARTPSNRASKKPRVKSPGPKTPKRSQPHKRVRSDPTETTSPPRKKLKEVTNGRTKRGAAARSQEVSEDEDASS